MKQFIYRAEDIGLPEWPSGTLRLNLDVTTDPAEADLFVCPGTLMLFQRPSDLDRFPHMAGNETKHVFFDVSDYETVYKKPCLFIRCNTRDWYLRTDPNTISWPWPVEDFADCIEVPNGGYKFDISFQGWLSSNVRKNASRSCLEQAGLSCDFATYSDFTGYIYETTEGVRRRGEFRRSMRESRIALCPESIPGTLPYRFLEAMSAGRVPLIVGSHYVLPFTDLIPYDDFILRCAADDAEQAGVMAMSFIGQTTDAEITRKGKLGRFYYKKYMDRDNWPQLMTDRLLEKIGAGQ